MYFVALTAVFNSFWLGEANWPQAV